jgi:hypothetical protein
MVDGRVDRQRINLKGVSRTCRMLRVRRRASTRFYVIQRITASLSHVVISTVAAVLVVPVRTWIVESWDAQGHHRLVVEGQELVGERPRCLPRRHGEPGEVLCLIVLAQFWVGVIFCRTSNLP